MKPETIGTPPCFYFAACGNRAAMNKGGRSVCLECAARVVGAEFPVKAAGERLEFGHLYPESWLERFSP